MTRRRDELVKKSYRESMRVKIISINYHWKGLRFSCSSQYSQYGAFDQLINLFVLGTF